MLTTSVVFILILPFVSRGAYIGGPSLLLHCIVCFVQKGPASFCALVSAISSLHVLALRRVSSNDVPHFANTHVSTSQN